MKQGHNYLPSIDSLRAIAVISVIIYHLNPNFLPGGFLGVDLFFVLSGYLISSLLIKEYNRDNKINLTNFYVRRARRLLPAVYFMISIVLITMVIFNKPLLEKSYLDGIFGYLYSSNWWYIFHKLDYFDSFGSNSPFKHLWSLAIEEQFYMLYPLIFILICKLFSNNWKKALKYVVIALIAISLITHILLFDINNINRVYYGTDTRAFSLLIGVLGSLIYSMDNMINKVSSKTSIIFTLFSTIFLFVFIGGMFFISEFSQFLYYGGFLLFALLFLAIIISAGHQNTIISKLLSFKPLVFIGKISYSLYLWHFPVIVMTTSPDQIGQSNWLIDILKVVVIFVLATISYILIETPIRQFGIIKFTKLLFNKFTKLGKFPKYSFAAVIIILTPVFFMGLVGKAMPVTSTLFVDADNNNNKVREFKTSNSDTGNSEVKLDDNGVIKSYNKALIIGDSLAIDIGAEFTNRYAGAIVDGKVSRQVYNSVDIVEKYKYLNNKGTAVIFLLGTNGLFTEQQLELLLKPLDKVDIYFVNTRVPRNWEKAVNKTLEDNKDKYSNLKIVDWYSASNNHPEYFAADKVHLTPEGATALVDLITNNLKYPIETKEMEEAKKLAEQRQKDINLEEKVIKQEFITKKYGLNKDVVNELEKHPYMNFMLNVDEKELAEYKNQKEAERLAQIQPIITTPAPIAPQQGIVKQQPAQPKKQQVVTKYKQSNKQVTKQNSKSVNKKNN